MNKLVVFTDGASRGNPGKAGVGVAIYDGDNNLIEEYSEYIGNTTNNVAEYTALKVGIERAIKLKANNVDFNLDSELIVKQLNGEYKVRNDKLKPLYFSIKSLLEGINNYNINHIPREMNKKADKLANNGIDNFLQQNP